MSRRTRGEGTLYKTKRGKWRAQIKVGGKRRSYSADTARECRDWLERQKQKRRAGLISAKANETLGGFLDEWLMTVKSSRSNSTYISYEGSVRLYIKPVLGDVLMSDLTPDVIQTAIIELVDLNKPTYSINLAFKRLRTALNHAVDLNILGYNPTKGVTLPKPEKSEIEIWDENQVQTYLLGIDAAGMRNGSLLKLAVGTGMRQGELIALMWKDINFSDKQISVRRQSAPHTDDKNVFKEPKSKSGIRTIRVGDYLINTLRKHKDEQLVDKKMQGEDWNDIGLVFPNYQGDTICRNSARYMHRKIIDQTGLPYITFHSLRHTAISLMLKNGVPVIEVSKYAGHANVSMTLDKYGHFIPSWHDNAAETMDRILSPVSISTR